MKKIGQDLSDLSFLITDQTIPTWWTQYPEKVPLLAGWIAGPDALDKKDWNEKMILDAGISSLSTLFQTEEKNLRDWLDAKFIVNWTAEPFTRGAYSYSTIHTKTFRPIATAPVEETLFFAGEAFYDGVAAGTVEAALDSGRKATISMMGNKKK
ncbi:MAG TPA: FAD-dependent oxidoreductase [Flavitalea sp.]|nr:FAD-dependent oxidoreductase [Flavitalea sp.]